MRSLKVTIFSFIWLTIINSKTVIVKSFGSEDRIVERPVPPRDDIFQLIIFRASDIKDLIVDEPTPQSTGSALGDPAIVQAVSVDTFSI